MLDMILNSEARYAIILIGIVIVLYIPVMIFMVKRKRGEIQAFTEEHPSAAKAFIRGVMAGSFLPISVNGEKPVMGNVGAKAAIYLIPGENIIEFKYTYHSGGIGNKNATTTIGPIKIAVQAEPYKDYNISYDKGEEVCKFEEISG